MNRLTKLLVFTGLILTILIYCLNEMQYGQKVDNYVELQAKYKNYLVINKSFITDKYFVTLKNPVTGKIEKVQVSDYVYYQVLFVSDTIK